MISIAALIVIFTIVIVAFVLIFVYAMAALKKGSVFIDNFHFSISKTTGINLSVSAKEKNEASPTSRKLRSEN